MTSKKKPACKYGEKCYRTNPDHLRSYTHPTKKSDEDSDDNVLPESTESPVRQSKTDKRKINTTTDSPEIETSSEKKRRTQEDDPQTTANSKNEESNDEEVEENDPPSSPADVKENIKMKFLVEMPEDFYQFWDFCSSFNPSDPQGALKCLKLKLVGPYDVLSGRHKKVRKNKYGRRPNFLLHYRFYYDPPEFQTVVVSQESDCLHFGYFRDDPAEKPVFVASNSPGADKSKEKITACGENIFAAIHIHASKMLTSGTPWEKTSIQKLIKSLEATAAEHNLNLSASTSAMKQRQKKVVCPSFHGAGIVVPVDDNDIGYRPVPETPGDLKAMFKRIAEAKTDKDRDKHLEGLQELITLIQFANDECDFGEGLELGIDLFSYGGSVFHSQISILLPLGYQLLNRSEFSSIITAHLNRRRGVNESVDELAV